MIEIFGFFLIGLTGGFGHCILMCHPFVLYISSRYVGSGQGRSFIIPHIYYNLGRIFTYSVLGAVAGFFGSVVQYAGSFVHIQQAAAICGGTLLIAFAIFSMFNIKLSSFPKLNIFKYFQKFQPHGPFLSGVFLGFLPCGLSMGAVIGAASSGSVILGALQTAAFGLGTSAAMFLTAFFGTAAMTYSPILKKTGSLLLLIMGLYFIYAGFSF